MPKVITIFFFLVISNISLGNVIKTVSSNINNSNYISYSLSKKENFSFYYNDKTYTVNYKASDFQLVVNNYAKNVNYKIKYIKNRTLFSIILNVDGKKIRSVHFTTENSPNYSNLNYSNSCETANKNPFDNFDFDEIGKNLVNKKKLSFSKNCDSNLEKIYGSKYNEEVSSAITDLELWNDQPTILKISEKVKSKSLISTSRESMDAFKRQSRKIATVNCSDDKKCDKLGSYSPVNDEITLYSSCINNSVNPRCSLKITLIEEILHNLTGIGNELPDHLDIKTIAGGFSDCEKFQIELDPTRSDFNQQAKIDIRPEQLPQPPVAPENLSQPFTMNPATDRPRTVTATAADRSFIGSLSPTISWAKNVATAAITLAERSSIARNSNPRSPASSLSRKSPDLLTNHASNSAQEKPKTSTKDQNTNLTELADATSNSETPSAQKASSELPRGRKASPQLLANADTANRAPIARTTAGSFSQPQQQRQPERSTASIPSQPIDASKMGSTLPPEISAVIGNANIRSVPDLISRLNDSQQRQQLSRNLKQNNISILGLGDQPLGETDLKKATSIYKYSTSGKSPKLINVRKNLPTNI